MAGALPTFQNECFFLAPIGEDGTDERRRSDGILQYIVQPAVRELGLDAIRADRIAKPGQITLQIIEHVLNARAAVADLTTANPNVYYELAVRHTAGLPTVLICETGEELPFDMRQMRTIFFDHRDLKSAADCSEQIASQLKHAFEGAVDSPITASVDLSHLRAGSPVEQTLAGVATTPSTPWGIRSRAWTCGSPE